MTTHYKMAAYPKRERPVNRLREVGPQSLSTSELLACILQTGDALHQALTLLTQVGGLEGLARAENCQLAQVPGVGVGLAARVQAAVELGRRIAMQKPEDLVEIRAPNHVAEVLVPQLQYQEQELFVILYLDTRNRVVDQETLYRGTLNSSLVRAAEVFRGAVRRNCAAIIISHNHPSGDPTPSPEDVALTRRLVEAGKLLDVEVLDHLIIGRGRYMSLRERGLGFE